MILFLPSCTFSGLLPHPPLVCQGSLAPFGVSAERSRRCFAQAGTSSTTSNLQNQLCAAVKAGEEDAVRKLLKADGADPAVPGDADPTRPPIYVAARDGFLEIVKMLLQHNADPNQAKTDTGPTPVYMAAQNGHVACVKVLLEHNADPNQGRTDDGRTPVFMAAYEGHVECTKALLENSADPNKATAINGAQTPLYAAARNGYVDVTKALLENNADPNQATTDDGQTPVFIAALQSHVECLQVLLEHNVDPNQALTTDGTTPLHAAAVGGSFLAAQRLVVHGANIAAAGLSGGGAPHILAAHFGSQGLAEWLTSVATWSPFRVAAALRMHACITFLLQHGRLDPDDRAQFPAAEIMAAIAVSAASPADLPWENALPICHATIKLVHAASFGWTYSTHQLYHANVRKAVFAVLVVADRLEKSRGNNGLGVDAGEGDGEDAAAPHNAPLPLLPPELWLFIVHFFQRSWWRVGI